jgi:hypothetical protein
MIKVTRLGDHTWAIVCVLGSFLIREVEDIFGWGLANSGIEFAFRTRPCVYNIHLNMKGIKVTIAL